MRIGNRVAHNRVARIGNYRILHIGNKVARSKVVRTGNRVARIGDYRVLRAFEADNIQPSGIVLVPVSAALALAIPAASAIEPVSVNATSAA